MKKVTKKIKQTQIRMQETRQEDTVRLRKKAEELIVHANEDVKFIIETKKKLLEEIKALDVRLMKTNGALSILKILLENNNA